MGEACESMEVRILTHNMFTPYMGCSNKQERLEDFANQASQFDILLLQELFVFSFGIVGSGYKSWMVERLEKEGFKYSAASPVPFLGQCSGLMIFSKFPIEKFNQQQDFVKFWNWRGREAWTSKGALKAKIKVHPKLPPLVCVCTHLQCDGGEENTATRLAQISQLKNRLLPKHSNYMVCGDFNICAINEPEYYQKLKALLAPARDILLEETISEKGLDGKKVDSRIRPVTVPNPDKAHESLDYMWVRADEKAGKKGVWDYVPGSAQVEKLKVSDASWGVRDPGTISDHFGLSCRMYLRK